LQYNSKLRIVKPKKPEIGVWKTVEAKGRRKYQKEKPKHIRGELPAKSKRQMNVNDASRLKNSKQVKSGPKQKFCDQNRRWNTFSTSMPFSSFGSLMIVPWGTYFGMPYSHAPWFHNLYMSFLTTYLCPNYVTYREPVIREPSPTNNDCFV
jgi:hypothetical protein